MIEARMTDPDPKQVLRYLGYRGQDMQTGIAWQIQKGIRTVGEIAAPRLVWRRLPVWNGEISGLPAKGQEIRDLLMPCREAVVMAATLGTQVEQMLMRLKVTDMADAVILDACASAAAEKVCDCFEEDLGSRIEAEGLFLTCRLCPGYGDFPVGDTDRPLPASGYGQADRTHRDRQPDPDSAEICDSSVWSCKGTAAAVRERVRILQYVRPMSLFRGRRQAPGVKLTERKRRAG